MQSRARRGLGRVAAPLRGLGMRLALAGIGALTCSAAHAGLGTAVEFYNKALNHYFVTAYPEEAAALDAGTNVKGWTRTGGQFTVFTEPAEGLQAVCRFFGTPNVGPNSHFYTADAAECAKVKTYPAWTFEGIAFYIPTTSNGDCGSNWPVYRSYYSDQIRDANHRFTVDLTAHVRMAKRRGDILEGVVMCAPVTDEEREADVVRFLEQATLGPTEALVQEVKVKGIERYLDEQLAMNVTRYTQYAYFRPPDDPTQCIDDDTPPVTPEKYCAFNHGSTPVALEFYRQSKTASDQIRMRMAHVWHQIYIATCPCLAYGIAEFQQRFRDSAFGTFEDLLARYTLSPVLGNFQNWVQNVPEHEGIKPNENFARELMQLFTIGVSELNDDGTFILDAKGQRVPAYGQADIETLARVLTGFTNPTIPGNTPDFWGNKWYLIGDMIPFDQFHDQGAKSALGGRLLLAPGGGAMPEVRTLLRTLVNHPNTPSFISRQLIQKTVTSSPTPQYVARIAKVFKDNGSGVRGDLAAVTRAVLLDPEARGARKIDPEYGRLREPILLWTAMIRALDMTSDGLLPQQQTYWNAQALFSAPTVFGYYPADYTLLGGNIPAPEFGIFTSSDYIYRVSEIMLVLYGSEIGMYPSGLWAAKAMAPQPFVANATGTPSPSLAAFLADGANADVLVERLNRLFLHGAMSTDMRSILVTAIDKLPASDPHRVRMALHLILTSTEYQVQQ